MWDKVWDFFISYIIIINENRCLRSRIGGHPVRHLPVPYFSLKIMIRPEGPQFRHAIGRHRFTNVCSHPSLSPSERGSKSGINLATSPLWFFNGGYLLNKMISRSEKRLSVEAVTAFKDLRRTLVVMGSILVGENLSKRWVLRN